MNNKSNSQTAAKRNRRTVRGIRAKQEARAMEIAQSLRGMSAMIMHTAQFGRSTNFGSPMYSPRRGKFKGYMRNA